MMMLVMVVGDVDADYNNNDGNIDDSNIDAILNLKKNVKSYKERNCEKLQEEKMWETIRGEAKRRENVRNYKRRSYKKRNVKN